MKELVNTITFNLAPYLCGELIGIISSYFMGFNTESLIFEKSFDIKVDPKNCKICVYNNKVYLPIYENGLIIIYDMETNKTFNFHTNLNSVCSIFNIDDNNIAIASSTGLYVYNYNIIDDKVNIISIDRKNEFYNYPIWDIYYFKETAIFSDTDICIKSINMNNPICLMHDIHCHHNSIFLHNNHLYFFNSEKNLIRVIDINNFHNITGPQLYILHKEGKIRKDKTILLSSLDDIMSDKSSIFVDQTYIYIKISKLINVYNHNGEFIRRININYPDLNNSLYISSNKIYLTQKFGDSLKFLIFRQNFKYRNFRKDS